MTIYTLFTAGGTEYDQMTDLRISRTLNEQNGASSFSATFPNRYGTFSDTFELNQDIVIKADQSDPPTTVIFGGIIEDISQEGEGTSQTLTISGRDYSALMQDVTVQPVVYRDEEIADIVREIVGNNLPIIDTSGVNDTGQTLDRQAFSHNNLFDAVSEMAKSAGFYFYVDEDKVLHFEERDSVSSGETFNNTNTTSADFVTQDRDIYNEVWVYGARIMTGANDQFTADGTGSVFVLSEKPHNTQVFVDDVLQQPGGVEGIDDPFNKLVRYLIDFDKKEVIFASGNAAGDNIPASGDFISIDYYKSTPIIRLRNDATSIAAYGKKVKIINEEEITSFGQANEKASTFLAENKDPIIQGMLKVDGFFNLTPGNTAIIDFPNQGIKNQTYRIIQINYDLKTATTTTESAISLRVNKKNENLTDTIKELILRQAAADRGSLETNIINFQTETGAIDVNDHWEMYALSGTLHPFRFHLEGHDQLNSPHAVLTPWILGSTFLQSGGEF